MGEIIVIEGTDGSGKETQSKLLLNRLVDNGYKCRRISYPAYNSWSSTLVQHYLNGDMGNDITKHSPYAIASIYASDRYIDYTQNWKSFYEQDNSIIIADRYTLSNQAFQSLYFNKYDDIIKFSEWCSDYEHNLLGIPRASKTIVLMMDPKLSTRLIKNRGGNKRENSSSDVYEDNADFIRRAYTNYHILSTYYGYEKIECAKYMTENSIIEAGDAILAIHNRILEIVSQLGLVLERVD